MVLRAEHARLTQLDSEEKNHGRDRWMCGYRLDDLYRELNLLHRCMQEVTREFFGQTLVSRNVEAAAHQLIEDLFSETIQTAIRQLIDEQDERISAAIKDLSR
ncbi:hypothetical protein PQQ51_33810 [Paraburkholderia xenovorans]|uniref:hypothetical protein n=1 Tax=Paraburkholderia xenovorans TaxID=36873 RepID=UPI0038B6B9DF